jgi:haloalkane dehalogenase
VAQAERDRNRDNAIVQPEHMSAVCWYSKQEVSIAPKQRMVKLLDQLLVSHVSLAFGEKSSMIQAAIPSHIRSQTIRVKDSAMHYLESGTGEPIVFLHGNPTSSYLWRNVIPHLEVYGRCLAVDYIGMGQSEKPAIAYRLVDHLAYIDAWLDALGITSFTLVTHDWGVVIGLALARRYPGRVQAIALMEGHIHPIARWDDFDAGSQTVFKDLRTPGRGETMVIEENFFIETILPAGTHRALSDAEMDAYRAPYRDKHTRIPMLRWVGEIPIEGEPADVHAIVVANQAYLATAAIPKLLLYASPGAIIGATEVAWCTQMCQQLTAIDIGVGIHFLPEDQPDAIGEAIADWLAQLPSK